MNKVPRSILRIIIFSWRNFENIVELWNEVNKYRQSSTTLFEVGKCQMHDDGSSCTTPIYLNPHATCKLILPICKAGNQSQLLRSDLIKLQFDSICLLNVLNLRLIFKFI